MFDVVVYDSKGLIMFLEEIIPWKSTIKTGVWKEIY